METRIIELKFKHQAQIGTNWQDIETETYSGNDDQIMDFLAILKKHLKDDIHEVRWNFQGSLQGHYIPAPTRPKVETVQGKGWMEPTPTLVQMKNGKDHPIKPFVDQKFFWSFNWPNFQVGDIVWLEAYDASDAKDTICGVISYFDGCKPVIRLLSVDQARYISSREAVSLYQLGLSKISDWLA